MAVRQQHWRRWCVPPKAKSPQATPTAVNTRHQGLEAQGHCTARTYTARCSFSSQTAPQVQVAFGDHFWQGLDPAHWEEAGRGQVGVRDGAGTMLGSASAGDGSAPASAASCTGRAGDHFHGAPFTNKKIKNNNI